MPTEINLGIGGHIPPLSREKLAELDDLHRKATGAPLVTTDLAHLLSLPAGAELDAAIHEHALGFTGTAPPFSAKIEWAWPLIDWLAKRFTNVSLCLDNGWGLTCWNLNRHEVVEDGVTGPHNADTAPLAICRTVIDAALRANLSSPQTEPSAEAIDHETVAIIEGWQTEGVT